MSTNDMSSTGRMADVEAQLMNQAMQDTAFRDRLLADPRTVLAEQGLAIPEDVQIQVFQETPNQYYLVLPAATSVEPVVLSDEELEAVSGGEFLDGVPLPSSQNTGWTGCGSGQSGCIVR